MAVVSSQVGPDEGEGGGGALQAGVGEREPRPVGNAAADADGGGLAGGEGGVPGRCAGTRREIACARAAERVVRWLPREMPVGMAAIGEASISAPGLLLAAAAWFAFKKASFCSKASGSATIPAAAASRRMSVVLTPSTMSPSALQLVRPISRSLISMTR